MPFTIGRAIPMPELAALQEKLHWIALSCITDEKMEGGFLYGTDYS